MFAELLVDGEHVDGRLEQRAQLVIHNDLALVLGVLQPSHDITTSSAAAWSAPVTPVRPNQTRLEEEGSSRLVNCKIGSY